MINDIKSPGVIVNKRKVGETEYKLSDLIKWKLKSSDNLIT